MTAKKSRKIYQSAAHYIVHICSTCFETVCIEADHNWGRLGESVGANAAPKNAKLFLWNSNGEWAPILFRVEFTSFPHWMLCTVHGPFQVTWHVLRAIVWVSVLCKLNMSNCTPPNYVWSYTYQNRNKFNPHSVAKRRKYSFENIPASNAAKGKRSENYVTVFCLPYLLSPQMPFIHTYTHTFILISTRTMGQQITHAAMAQDFIYRLAICILFYFILQFKCNQFRFIYSPTLSCRPRSPLRRCYPCRP